MAEVRRVRGALITHMSAAPRGGKLTLKGGINLKAKKDKAKKSKKKKSKKKKKRKERQGEEGEEEGGAERSAAEDQVALRKRARVGDGGLVLPPGFSKISGAGRLLTSGSTVYGKGTRFFKDAAVGDALMVRHPASLARETRVIKMILSDESLALSSGFSTDLISQTSYHVLKRPPRSKSEIEKDIAAAQSKTLKERAETHAQAYGTYGGGAGQTVTYRERLSGAHGSYRIVTAKVEPGMSRSDLLNLRCKKKGDRMTM